MANRAENGRFIERLKADIAKLEAKERDSHLALEKQTA